MYASLVGGSVCGLASAASTTPHHSWLGIEDSEVGGGTKVARAIMSAVEGVDRAHPLTVKTIIVSETTVRIKTL
jgi:hypothetical protein